MNGHDDAAGAPDSNNTNFAGANNPHMPQAQGAGSGNVPQIQDPTAVNASQGGIFSTPDLTISAENLPPEVTTGASAPEVAAAHTASNQSRIAAAFAKTDATVQQQSVEDAMQIIPNSNLTTSSATGDIKLQPTPKKRSKLPVILVAIIGIALAGVAVALQFLKGGSDTNVAALLREHQESLAAVEEIYSSAFYSELNVEQLFSNGVHDTLNADLPKLASLSASLEKVDLNKIKADAREEFSEIRTVLAERAASYEATLKLYNILYEAFKDEDSSKLDAIAELQQQYPNTNEVEDDEDAEDNIETSENQTVTYLYERFKSYLDDITARNEIYVNYGCVTNTESEECTAYFDQYIEIVVDFVQNTSIPYAVLSAYDNNAYGKNSLLQDKVATLIGELE